MQDALNQYTAGLARDAKARTAMAEAPEGATVADPALSEREPAEKRPRRARIRTTSAGAEGDAA